MYQFLLALALLVTPTLVLAQGNRPNFGDFVTVVTDLIQLLVIGIFSLTFLVLVWTITKTWIISGGDQMEIEKGKHTVTVGVIVLVIMSGIWGILALLRQSVFGL